MSFGVREEREDSVFLRHEACPKCRETGNDKDGNNLARYADGSAYCFACGYVERADGQASDSPRPTKPKDLLDVTYKAIRPRGINQDTCELFGYGISKYHGMICHVAPYYSLDGSLCGQHIRLENKEFRWIGESKDIQLFGQKLWKAGGRRLIITEGEIDCLTVSQLQGNKWAVVSLPNGVKRAKKDILNNYDFVSSFKEILLCFDMDEPGRQAAKEVAEVLPIGKAYIVALPEKDANDCLLKGKAQAVITALWQAQAWRPDGIKSGLDLWEQLTTPPQEGYDTPYPKLNEMVNGFRKGELYLFTAGSGIGKSTIVNEIAYSLKANYGLSIGVLALEESPARNARRYLGIYLNKPIHLPQAFHSVSDEEMKEAFNYVMGDKKWWIYDHFGSTDIDTMLNKIRYMIVALGCDVIVLDHISIIVSGLDTESNDERKTIDILMTKLRSLIEETGVMVLAVVHLRRPDNKGKSYNEGRQVSLTDLRGSGGLEQLSDVVIALERDQQADGEEANISTIRVLKNRPIGITGEAGQVQYYPDTGRLLPCIPFESFESESQQEEDYKGVF